ncbi:MAG: hypothetical protein PWP15_788 [Methanothermococcus sp.]|jgi:hypothetical protein|uniref:DUF7388 family protein n=1 Tax=Methanothermococcus TaxID=155862 RepID=UPI0003620315|nr:hypothetical protein [Methanothermococcus thermolithotrophicus]MDK2790281.1 hypothetical protein [Methanothermococcus sp.]MDK2987787.1 hypothetical protein [Methanothermococcus sp.]
MLLCIATKLSQINKNDKLNEYKDSRTHLQRLIELNKKVSKHFDYHVIDAEEHPLTDEETLENLKKAVLTIQSRRKDAFDLLDLYSSYDIEICVVLGNKAYLSGEELKFKRSRILDVLNRALELKNDIWVGTEGVEDIVKNIIIENDLIYYYVYGCDTPDSSSEIKQIATYIPFANNVDTEILKSMEGYLSRRFGRTSSSHPTQSSESFQNYYMENWKNYILSLNDMDEDIIKEIKNKNKIIVGYPINLDFDEIIGFKRIFI